MNAIRIIKTMFILIYILWFNLRDNNILHESHTHVCVSIHYPAIEMTRDCLWGSLSPSSLFSTAQANYGN